MKHIPDDLFKNLVLRLLLSILWVTNGRELLTIHRDLIDETKRAIK